jgi:hypothetical protein
MGRAPGPSIDGPCAVRPAWQGGGGLCGSFALLPPLLMLGGSQHQNSSLPWIDVRACVPANSNKVRTPAGAKPCTLIRPLLQGAHTQHERVCVSRSRLGRRHNGVALRGSSAAVPACSLTRIALAGDVDISDDAVSDSAHHRAPSVPMHARSWARHMNTHVDLRCGWTDLRLSWGGRGRSQSSPQPRG